ncbi:MAG TPA: putative quinol monooxygenase [bacterium]|nr:putative quinol monooxygenase [bacterium]
MSFHFVVRFDPPAGKAEAFRAALLAVLGPARAEPGCVVMRAFESVREPRSFAIHSEWVDAAAFETHSTLPHTVRFVTAAEELLGRPVQGLRLRQIGGGPGAAGRPGPPS